MEGSCRKNRVVGELYSSHDSFVGCAGKVGKGLCEAADTLLSCIGEMQPSRRIGGGVASDLIAPKHRGALSNGIICLKARHTLIG